MRIAFATDWFAPRRGGIETQLTGLARGLAARGHEVDVITSTPGAAHGDGYRVRPIRSGVIPALDLALTPALVPELRHLLRETYDVVHAHVSVVSPVAYAAAMVAASLGRPVVVTFHSVLRTKRFWLGLANRVLHFDESSIRWSAVSRSVAAQVRRALPDAEIDVLPNGIDLDFWRAAGRAASTDDVRFISAMRLHSKKRPRQLLRAFADATSDKPVAASLTLVGDGPELRALQREAHGRGLLSSGRVRFVPWATPTELRRRYASSDVFVSACQREAFGIAALEARAAGLPVIAMRQAGSSEFLHDGEDSILCDDQGELTAAIARLTTNADLRRRFGSARPALDMYDWPAVLYAHEQSYARALEQSTSAKAAAR